LVGYSFVYHAEIGLLFITLALLGPLVRRSDTIHSKPTETARFGLADFPM